MTPRYFNESGEEVALGFNIATPEEAAYTTTNPDDPIFSKPAPGKAWRIIDGAPVQVDRSVDKIDLENFIKQQRDETIRKGITITSTFRVRNVVTAGYTQNIRLTDRIRSDVNALVIDYNIANPDSTEVTPLKVGKDVYFIIDSKEKVNALFNAGKEIVMAAYNTEAVCSYLLSQAKMSEYPQLMQQMRGLWAAVSVNRTI